MYVCVYVSSSVVSDSLGPHGLFSQYRCSERLPPAFIFLRSAGPQRKSPVLSGGPRGTLESQARAVPWTVLRLSWEEYL